MARRGRDPVGPPPRRNQRHCRNPVRRTWPRHGARARRPLEAAAPGAAGLAPAAGAAATAAGAAGAAHTDSAAHKTDSSAKHEDAKH